MNIYQKLKYNIIFKQDSDIYLAKLRLLNIKKIVKDNITVAISNFL